MNENEFKKAITRRNLTIAAIILIVFSLIRPVLLSIERQSSTTHHSTIKTPLISHTEDKPKASDTSTPVDKSKLSQASSPPEVDNSELIGIDVSHYDGDIEWQTVKKQGIHFTFIKATQGIHFIDPKFEDNRNGAVQAKIDFGSYHFFEPQHDPIEQAQLFLQVIGHQPLLRPVIDIEVSGGLESAAIAAGVKDWLKTVEATVNCKPIIYSGKDFWQTHLQSTLADYPLWIADYNPNFVEQDSEIPWLIWQSSESDHVKGIRSSVDLNQLRQDETSLEKLVCKRG